jgi:hypothetical protein
MKKRLLVSNLPSMHQQSVDESYNMEDIYGHVMNDSSLRKAHIHLQSAHGEVGQSLIL